MGHGQLHRAWLEHRGPGFGHLQHLLVADEVEPACVRHDARIGGEHARDVGKDRIRCAQSRRHGHRGSIGATPAQVVTSPLADIPWKPVTSTIEPSASASRMRWGSTSFSRALP